MAQFGAKKPRWAPVQTQPDGTLPTYDAAKKIVLGRLVKADLSPKIATGELYADDGLAERIDEFSSGSLVLGTDDLTDANAAAIYGATLDADSKELSNGVSDTPPYGGVTYYKTIIRNGERIYKGVYLPLVKAAVGNDSAATKGSSITFGTTDNAFTVFKCNSGKWRIQKEFTGTGAEAACDAWCADKLGTVSP